MNTRMNGKLIDKVLWPDGSSKESTDDCGLHLSATYHGDRDEFWIVETDSDGMETGRHNVRFADYIQWVEPIAATPQTREE